VDQLICSWPTSVRLVLDWQAYGSRWGGSIVWALEDDAFRPLFETRRVRVFTRSCCDQHDGTVCRLTCNQLDRQAAARRPAACTFQAVATARSARSGSVATVAATRTSSSATTPTSSTGTT